MDKTGVPEENNRPAASHWQTFSHNAVSSTPSHERTLLWDDKNNSKNETMNHTVLTLCGEIYKSLTKMCKKKSTPPHNLSIVDKDLPISIFYYLISQLTSCNR